MKVKDLNVGDNVNIILAVKEAQLKSTKGGKPYLAMTLFDGDEIISANHWDYYSQYIPKPNDIVDIIANVSTWKEKKQLTIQSFKVRRDLDIKQFAPQGNINVEQYIKTLNGLINSINNPVLKELTEQIIVDNLPNLKVKPAAKTFHHAYVAGLLKHSVDVASHAANIASYTDNCSEDLCIAGGLLHDIGKLWTYNIDGVDITMSLNGELIEHISKGLIEIEKYRNKENTGLIDLLQHIIASHHGKLEYGSPVTPKFLEAWIVHFCDNLDAKINIVQEINQNLKKGELYTDKQWALENQKMISQEYIKSIVGGA
jgi:3'-5' exoribonuclease